MPEITVEDAMSLLNTRRTEASGTGAVRSSVAPQSEVWPALDYRAWKPTCTTLHLWTQIVGKVRLAQTPWINHSWQVTLYPTARGLTTSTIPYRKRTFQVDFDFIADELRVVTSDGGVATVALKPACPVR